MTILITCEFIGGPLDGAIEQRKVTVPPGECVRVGVKRSGWKWQYVYQSLVPWGEGCKELRIEFVQVLPVDEDVYE